MTNVSDIEDRINTCLPLLREAFPDKTFYIEGGNSYKYPRVQIYTCHNDGRLCERGVLEAATFSDSLLQCNTRFFVKLRSGRENCLGLNDFFYGYDPVALYKTALADAYNILTTITGELELFQYNKYPVKTPIQRVVDVSSMQKMYVTTEDNALSLSSEELTCPICNAKPPAVSLGDYTHDCALRPWKCIRCSSCKYIQNVERGESQEDAIRRHPREWT